METVEVATGTQGKIYQTRRRRKEAANQEEDHREAYLPIEQKSKVNVRENQRRQPEDLVLKRKRSLSMEISCNAKEQNHLTKKRKLDKCSAQGKSISSVGSDNQTSKIVLAHQEMKDENLFKMLKNSVSRYNNTFNEFVEKR